MKRKELGFGKKVDLMDWTGPKPSESRRSWIFRRIGGQREEKKMLLLPRRERERSSTELSFTEDVAVKCKCVCRIEGTRSTIRVQCMSSSVLNKLCM